MAKDKAEVTVVPVEQRRLERVQFHTGVQFHGQVLTGLAISDPRHKNVSMQLLPYGVHIALNGEEYVVPYSNVISTKLLAGAVL